MFCNLLIFLTLHLYLLDSLQLTNQKPNSMKRFLLASLSLILTTISFSQGSFTYSITVQEPGQRPKSNLPITLVETSTFERKALKTNASGQLTIVLTEGKQWMMNVGDMKGHTLLNVPQNGSGKGQALISYDVARWNRLNASPTDRSLFQLEDIPQRIHYNAMPTKTHEIMEIAVESEKGRPYKGLVVKMTCFALNTSYSAYTDDQGIARFQIPLNESYQIDLDGEDNFEYHDAGSKPYRRRMTLTYEKINFKEEVQKDGYIQQLFIDEPRPISNRVMVTLKVRGGDKNGANENIYIQTDYSQKKYKGKTNSNGDVAFLLPKKRTYTVSFDYQDVAGAIDLSRFYGIGEMTQGVYYEPDPRLQYPERYLPSKDDVNEYDINNYTDKVYDDTDDDNLVNVHVKWGNNKIHSGSKEALLELGFSTKEPANKTAVKTPLNIAFVLDKSGSMSGEKIDFLKSAMTDFIKKLRPMDRISIVFFDTEAVLAYDKSGIDQSYLADIIVALQASGGTNIYEGLKLGYGQVAKNKTSNSVDRVILLTDGYGSKPVDFILEQSADYFKQGIAVSTIGVGDGYNQSLLSLISQYSGGLEHQVIESEGITTALDKEFESLLYPLASNLTVQVRYNNRLIYKTLYGVPEFKNTDSKVVFKLDKVFSSLNKMALIKFKIENPTRDIAKNEIEIEVNYFDEIKQQEVTILKKTHLEWTDETDAELIADNALKQTYSVAVINQALKVIADNCDAKNYGEAKQIVNQTLKSLKKITGDKYSEELIPIVELLKEYLVSLDRAIAKK